VLPRLISTPGRILTSSGSRPTAAAVFLVLTIQPGGEEAVRDLLADVSGLRRSVGFRLPEGALAVVTAIGSDAWDRLFAGPRPAELHAFRELAGSRHRAPATPGDLLFHIRANRMDLCFEFATQVMARLGDVVEVVEEVHGFRYFDERDLIGFVDGTESPQGPAGVSAALVGEDADPAFAGGSIGFRQSIVKQIRATDPTVREYLKQTRYTGSGHHGFAGTPEQFADHVEDWWRSGAIDGFNLQPDVLADGLEVIADEVVPLLRRRGLFRHEYETPTLRGHFAAASGRGVPAA